MYEELLASIQEREPWLRDFGRQTYRDAFRSYTERFGPLFMEAVRNQDPADLAKALLDGLDAGWRAQRFWRRGVVRAEEKQMVVVYLSPMLLGLEEAGCQSLAQARRRVSHGALRSDPGGLPQRHHGHRAAEMSGKKCPDFEKNV